MIYITISTLRTVYIHTIQLACFTYEYKCVYVYVQYKQPEYKAIVVDSTHFSYLAAFQGTIECYTSCD